MTGVQTCALPIYALKKQQVQNQAKQILQQQPNPQNFMERMKALSTLYAPMQ